jgi:hypothetical protein
VGAKRRGLRGPSSVAGNAVVVNTSGTVLRQERIRPQIRQEGDIFLPAQY